LACMELIQKRALVRILRSDACAVELVERETLEGVDMILDPHTAIIIFPLLSLPSQCDTLTQRLCEVSWCYA
ncbi:hypothetical protein FISHEDRAFT_25448, partial [Fistulina hepatica ATCC 64428]